MWKERKNVCVVVVHICGKVDSVGESWEDLDEKRCVGKRFLTQHFNSPPLIT